MGGGERSMRYWEPGCAVEWMPVAVVILVIVVGLMT